MPRTTGPLVAAGLAAALLLGAGGVAAQPADPAATALPIVSDLVARLRQLALGLREVEHGVPVVRPDGAGFAVTLPAVGARDWSDTIRLGDVTVVLQPEGGDRWRVEMTLPAAFDAVANDDPSTVVGQVQIAERRFTGIWDVSARTFTSFDLELQDVSIDWAATWSDAGLQPMLSMDRIAWHHVLTETAPGFWDGALRIEVGPLLLSDAGEPWFGFDGFTATGNLASVQLDRFAKFGRTIEALLEADDRGGIDDVVGAVPPLFDGVDVALAWDGPVLYVPLDTANWAFREVRFAMGYHGISGEQATVDALMSFQDLAVMPPAESRWPLPLVPESATVHLVLDAPGEAIWRSFARSFDTDGGASGDGVMHTALTLSILLNAATKGATLHYDPVEVVLPDARFHMTGSTDIVGMTQDGRLTLIATGLDRLADALRALDPARDWDLDPAAALRRVEALIAIGIADPSADHRLRFDLVSQQGVRTANGHDFDALLE